MFMSSLAVFDDNDLAITVGGHLKCIFQENKRHELYKTYCNHRSFNLDQH
jgi:hypothetical protein